MVYDGEDCIVAFLLREAHDEIHCNLLEWGGSFFCIYLVEGCLLLMGEDLILLAVCTPFDVVHYPLMHTCPFAYFSGFSDGFILSWVSYSRVVVN